MPLRLRKEIQAMSRSIDAFLKVAVGIIINPANEVLVSLRPAHTPHGGLWEFPGGKFESDESCFEALKRELREEIGIEVLEAVPLIIVRHDYGTIHVELDTWHVTAYSGEPYGRENQHIRWVNQTALSLLTFPDGNREIVKKISEVLQSSVAA
jgi:8-oxo-dGTP diphosphatase